jgi:hypothetical protein
MVRFQNGLTSDYKEGLEGAILAVELSSGTAGLRPGPDRCIPSGSRAWNLVVIGCCVALFFKTRNSILCTLCG